MTRIEQLSFSRVRIKQPGVGIYNSLKEYILTHIKLINPVKPATGNLYLAVFFRNRQFVPGGIFPQPAIFTGSICPQAVEKITCLAKGMVISKTLKQRALGFYLVCSANYMYL